MALPHRPILSRRLPVAACCLAAAALLLGCAASSDPANRAAAQVVAREMQAQRLPGVAFAVVQGGQVRQAQGLGSAHLEHAVPVTPDSVFQSGSLGKQFTAVAVMLLVEDGRLSLDDPVARHLPQAPAAWAAITVRHLLTHTAGLPPDDDTLDLQRDQGEDELVQRAFALPLLFPPGQRWSYSNVGYVLLGAVIRQASGQSYGDLLQARVFTPLGMSSARVISESALVPHRVAGYRLVDGQWLNQEWVAPGLNTTADGSLYLSLRDWVRWAQALRRREVLQPASWDEVFRPVRLRSGRTFPYGFGWELPDGRGPAAYQHSGAWQGFSTAYLHALDEDLTVVVLSNLADADPVRVAHRVAWAHQPSLRPPAPQPIPFPDPALTARVQALLASAAAGRLGPADFEFLPPGFFPQEAEALGRLLAGPGPLQGLELLQRGPLGDDTVLHCRLRWGEQPLRLALGLGPGGGLTRFELWPEPPPD